MLVYCLFEHQSRVDPWIVYRLLQYMLHIWQREIQAGTPPGQLPPIIPLVLHQGPQAWTISCQFVDQLNIPAELKASLVPLQPSFEHLLIDLPRLPVEQMGEPLVLRLVLAAMKAARQGQIMEWLEGFLPYWTRLLEQEQWEGIVMTLLRYLFEVESRVEDSTIRAVLARVEDQSIRERVMSIAEQFRAEGRAEGRAKGRAEGRAEGRRAAILSTIELRFGIVPETVRIRVERLEDDAALAQALQAAVTSPALAELEERLARI